MRGLEPPTFGLRIRYSAKLSYIPIMVRLTRLERANLQELFLKISNSQFSTSDFQNSLYLQKNNFMIFITGCTGLVGSHLVAELINRQRTTDNGRQTLSTIKLLCRKNSDLSLFHKVLKRYGIDELPDFIKFVYGDILDYDILEEAMRDVDGVYHCAAVVSLDRTDKNSLRY